MTLSEAPRACNTGNDFMRRQRGSRRLPRRLGLWLAAVCATACAQVLGDIQVEKRPVQPVASVENMANEPSGAVSTTTGCEPGDSRCSEDGQLQACVRFEPGAPAGWLNQYNCG